MVKCWLYSHFFLVVEGVFLNERSQSPYDGDTFHETPTGLFFYSHLLKLNNGMLRALFIFCDILTAFALMQATNLFFKDIVSYAALLVIEPSFHLILIAGPKPENKNESLSQRSQETCTEGEGSFKCPTICHGCLHIKSIHNMQLCSYDYNCLCQFDSVPDSVCHSQKV